jgi:hypothetical protein
MHVGHSHTELVIVFRFSLEARLLSCRVQAFCSLRAFVKSMVHTRRQNFPSRGDNLEDCRKYRNDSSSVPRYEVLAATIESRGVLELSQSSMTMYSACSVSSQHTDAAPGDGVFVHLNYVADRREVKAEHSGQADEQLSLEVFLSLDDGGQAELPETSAHSVEEALSVSQKIDDISLEHNECEQVQLRSVSPSTTTSCWWQFEVLNAQSRWLAASKLLDNIALSMGIPRRALATTLCSTSPENLSGSDQFKAATAVRELDARLCKLEEMKLNLSDGEGYSTSSGPPLKV